MNSPRDPKNQLLAETFHGDWETGAPAHFARRAAAHARRQRLVRRSLAGGGVAALLALGVFAFRSHPAPHASAVVARASAPANSRGYEIISDEQLVAQLRDREVMVVKNSDGTQRVIVLPNE